MKNIILPVIASVLLFTGYVTVPSKAAVTLVGGVIKASHVDVVKKYKRKDCPVCKGKGKYLSGDGIKWVDCGYCEPDKTQPPPPVVSKPSPVIVVPPAVECDNGSCSQIPRRRILRK
jgi:hypothetical protein